jgi:hypothetical protein
MTTPTPLFDLSTVIVVFPPVVDPVTELTLTIRRAVAEYDYPVLLMAVQTGQTGGVEITDTRIVQARLKHALTEERYCLAEADACAGKGMEQRALELSRYALYHDAVACAAVDYLKAVGADYRDFLATGSTEMLERAA